MGDEFLITVITVVYNAEKEIEKTLASVLNQLFQPFEYVIVDGGSTDTTNVIIKRMIEEQPNKNISIRYISEKDNGIYNAMNKAVNMSRGKYILHINNGDLLFDNYTLQEAADYITNHMDKAFIYGDAIDEQKGWYKLRQDICLKHIKDCMSISHQAIFIRRNELLLHPYDENYKICADYFFVLERFLNESNDFQYIPVTVALSMYGGVSTTCVRETAAETLHLRKILGVISEEDYEVEMERILAPPAKNNETLKNLIRRLIPLCLREKRGDKKRIEYYEKKGWRRSIQECLNAKTLFIVNGSEDSIF